MRPVEWDPATESFVDDPEAEQFLSQGVPAGLLSLILIGSIAGGPSTGLVVLFLIYYLLYLYGKRKE
jgi:hypothetical protein